ncbi:hypothetical protein ASPWEDRAFT_109966 [Aspergillus wentii DTO 134E9]|uniref:DUF1993 domain-containing protein n=1 Tax=Aspergillus wentii DTO 134E9 TaxID=1073089 RepID=A0A1L9RKW7_ASPWE|nr:uncharacterized protein ASPWEDRAFT_109966 [Aspergillus wentii DTO 134E9]KAI9924665.1 hypothetical protein MW887_006940 [Aspergillus wentii]OJJ35570.1 hypothetical protein ASPWEDRAFT_109966 [Aspergillus wentii DTO 134E9]
MAGTTLYEASIPTFQNGLTSLKAILTKAVEHYGEDVSSLPSATLIDNLLPLDKHVQVASNVAKKFLERVADIPTEVWPDTEDTAEKLIQRCQRTLDLLATVTPAQIDGLEEKRIEFSLGQHHHLVMSAKEYVLRYAVPFFFFHTQLAYSILRAKGVPIGYADFLMPHIGPFTQ